MHDAHDEDRDNDRQDFSIDGGPGTDHERVHSGGESLNPAKRGWDRCRRRGVHSGSAVLFEFHDRLDDLDIEAETEVFPNEGSDVVPCDGLLGW